MQEKLALHTIHENLVLISGEILCHFKGFKSDDLQNAFRHTVSTNAFLKTTVRNNVFVLDFIVHYLLHVSAPIGGHLQVICK
jgi:hypothetical protein